MSEPVEVARIEIVKSFDDRAEGGASVHVAYSDGLSLVDALGMLAFAQWATPDAYLNDDEGDT